MVTTSVTLLDRFRDPADAEAWASFVDMYAAIITKWVQSSRVANQDVADVVQEVFVTLARTLPDFEYDAQRSFGAWLRVVTRNCCHRFLSRQRPHASLDTDNVAHEDTDVMTAVDETEYRQHVAQKALRMMQAEFEFATWKACWESVVEDRSAKEVADELGLSVNAVYVAKSRVLRRLRDQLDGVW